MVRKRKKIILAGAIVVVVAAATTLGLWWFNRGDTPTEPAKKPVAAKPTAPTETRIKLAAMGDMLAHDSVIANAATSNGYDFAPYFANIKPSYKDADIVFCNQEGLSGGAAFGISGYPSFNAPTEFADGLSGGGCNVINLANNHMGDKSQTAINATLDKWDALKPLAVAGANRNAEEQNTLKTFEVKGIKFAFLAFADFNNNKATAATAVNIYHNTALFDAMLAKARAEADVVIVSMHWGTEDSAVINADQRAQVEKMRQANVDIVIGTGPHIMQATEWVDKADGGKMLTWYSIGNMLSTQLGVDELTGCIAQLEVVKKADNKITIENPSCTPTFMSYYWTDAEKASQDLLKRKDLQLKPLKDSVVEVPRMFPGHTIESRQAYAKATLGDAVKINW